MESINGFDLVLVGLALVVLIGGLLMLFSGVAGFNQKD